MSQFTNPLVLTLVEDGQGRAILRAGRCQWSISRLLIYDVGKEFSGESIRVPPNFVTDLASIPSPFTAWLPPDGPWAKAAVVHDFLYFTAGTGVFQGACWIDRNAPYTWQEANAIFDEAMGVVGVEGIKRQAINDGLAFAHGTGWGT